MIIINKILTNYYKENIKLKKLIMNKKIKILIKLIYQLNV